MTIHLLRSFRRFSYFTSALFIFSVFAISTHAEVLNENATRQIWKLKYGVADAQMNEPDWLLQDSDGDGLANGVEITAGTNPFKAGSAVRVTSITNGGPTVDLTFSTENGKEYVVQATPALTTPFTNTAIVEVGNGTPKTVTVSKGENKFFRVLVRDIDTDSDGVSNWAELAVTLNPGTAETVPGTNDLAYVNQQIALPNVVSIRATEPFASEDGPVAGKLTVTRTQNLFPTTVHYGLSGTATEDSDYAALGAHLLVFPARGETSQNIFVNPTVHPAVEGSESVTATLTPPGDVEFPFTLGVPSSATVIIYDSTVPTGTGLLARYYDNANSTAADALNFGATGTYVFSRGTPTTTGSIVVTAAGSQFTGLQVGHLVKLTFTSGSGNIDNATYDHQNFPVTAVGTNSFTVSINSATSFNGTTSTPGNCNFSLQTIAHPAAVERIDPTVNLEFGGGTANGNFIAAAHADNFSTVWEGYLQPTTAGNYEFQLDADNKARVLMDLNLDGDFLDAGEQILEHGWEGTAETIGIFKQSAALPLAIPANPSQRYKIRVEHVELTGGERCRLQWRVNGGTFTSIPRANIFTHTEAATYAFTRADATTGTATITLPGHGLSASAKIVFSGSNLFTPNTADPAGYSRTYNISNVTTDTFDIAVTGTGLPASVGAEQACFVEDRPASTTTGWFSRTYGNTTVDQTKAPGRVTVDTGEGTSYGNLLIANCPDNYSSVWDAYLHPTSAGNYQFQLDADDKARVILYRNVNGTFDAGEVILEHGWDTATVETVGTFKQSAVIPLVVPANPGLRHRIRVEHVDLTGEARCRLQWRSGSNAFGNISQNNVFTHTQAATYAYDAATRRATITMNGHGLTTEAKVAFSAGLLSTPNVIDPAGYSGMFSILNPTANTFEVLIPGNNPLANVGAGTACFVEDRPASATTGWFNRMYANTAVDETKVAARIGVDGAGPTNTNNGLYGLGSPDPSFVEIDTFSARWTGQIQPQFTEEYTLAIQADDACSLWINGQPQALEVGPSANTGGSVYTYDRSTGNLVVNYSGLIVVPGSFVGGETVRLDPSGGNLNHAPSTSPTYTYNPVTGIAEIDYTSLTNGSPNPGATLSPGSLVVGETIEVDPTSGSLNALGNLPYVITAVSGNKFSVDARTYLNIIPTVAIASIAVSNPCQITTAQAHNLANGAQVRISSVSGGTFSSPINDGLYTVTFISTTKFSVALACTVAPATDTGTIAASGNINVNDNRNAVVTAIHATGTGTYSYNNADGATTVTFTNLGLPADTFQENQKIALDPTTGPSAVSALPSAFYTIKPGSVTANTFAVNLPQGLVPSGNTPGNITIVAPSTAAVPTSQTTAFTVNIGANKYADNSSNNVNVDMANKQFKDWSSNGNERYVRLPMIGGVRYDIRLDYWENGGFAKCQLYWFSPSQPRQIVPAERLYPASEPQAPPTHIAATDATALTGGAFTHAIVGSNAGTVTISGNPAWLTYSNGVLTGTPPAGAGGDYQIIVTITNTAGTSTSVVNLRVEENAGSVVRESWNGTYAHLGNIPTDSNPTNQGNLASLEGSDLGDNYGARVRGYITAPTTGNYYFWVAGSNQAELWISNDAEPINAFKRAWVTNGSTTPLTWNTDDSQKSPWLALEQGKKYYFEVLHKAVTGPDNIAVGWAQPGEATTAPSGVVPGYVLSPYATPAPGSTPGTLYIATMLAQNGAVTKGVGTSTLRVSEDGSVAYMRYSYSGLSDSITSQHIHWDPPTPGNIIFDIDTPVTVGDGLITDPNDPNYGAYKWTILPIAGLSAADIVEFLRQGKAYINLHTALYPEGEIRGNYTLANGTRTFTPPPPVPNWADNDDSGTNNGASRFLGQATFGANSADIAALKAITPANGKTRYELWIEDQFSKAATPHLPEVLAREGGNVFESFDERISFNTWWKNSITGQDQLRQRIAFALSEIHVVSGQGPLDNNARALAHFYDTLAAHAFGNFRDVLVATTLTPAMGRYLDMLRNDKPDLGIGRIPNENYAREIKQLFSIGLYRMWPDGSLMLTSNDSPIDTYAQREVVGFSHVFTGWDYGYDFGDLASFSARETWTRPMRVVPVRHFTGQKRVLNNEVMPGLPTVGGQPLDPYATHLSSQYYDPAYQALPGQELAFAHDQLFNHPNTGPFICRQLIQRLVTSHPSRGYLYRVVQKFNDDGSTTAARGYGRGNLDSVIKAILLDYEARSSALLAIPAFGKQREPIIRVANAARAFRPTNVTGSYSQDATTLATTLFTGSLNNIAYSNAPTITITTSTPHGLAPGNSVFLEFTDATPGGAAAPATGTYTVLSVVNLNQYRIPAPGWMGGGFSQNALSGTMTITMTNHWLPGTNANQTSLPSANWGQAYFNFISAATGTLPANGWRTAQSSSAYDTPSGVGNTNTVGTTAGSTNGTHTFTIPAPDTNARTGAVMMTRFTGSYACTGRNGIITIDTSHHRDVGNVGLYGFQADHALKPGDEVFLNFTNSRDTTSFAATSTENDHVYTVLSVPDPNTFTVQADDRANAAMNSDNQVVIFPRVPQVLTRNGTINTRQSTYAMNNTDNDLAQTPLNSPTVFNYFLPDYKYSGALASQGITTPEFELTSETTVIRQANFLYNGIFNPANQTTGISGFYTSGTNDLALVMDISPWMGNADAAPGSVGAALGAGPQTGQVWTSNANVSTLIDRMNTLLLGGGLPAGAKSQIQNFVGRQISGITAGTPCTVNMTTDHGWEVGDSITVTGVTGGTFSGGSTTGNGTFTVSSVPSSTTVRLTNMNCSSTTTNGGLNLSNSAAGLVPNTNAVQHSRDRLRAILHFILTSPDYTIQR